MFLKDNKFHLFTSKSDYDIAVFLWTNIMKQKLVEQDRQRFGNICMTQGKNVVFV